MFRLQKKRVLHLPVLCLNVIPRHLMKNKVLFSPHNKLNGLEMLLHSQSPLASVLQLQHLLTERG